MACGESNGRVTDDVTRPQKFKFVTPICIEPNILKTAGNVIKQHYLDSLLWGSAVGYPSDTLASC